MQFAGSEDDPVTCSEFKGEHNLSYGESMTPCIEIPTTGPHLGCVTKSWVPSTSSYPLGRCLCIESPVWVRPSFSSLCRARACNARSPCAPRMLRPSYRLPQGRISLDLRSVASRQSGHCPAPGRSCWHSQSDRKSVV